MKLTPEERHALEDPIIRALVRKIVEHERGAFAKELENARRKRDEE